jgi:hypothetical protein
MPQEHEYLYGCDKDKSHTRVVIYHGRNEVVNTFCPDCGSPMHRIPQMFSYYIDPRNVIRDKLYGEFRERQRRKKLGLPQKPR